jgi:hypothetical protein
MATEYQENENPLAKFDAPTLREIGSTDGNLGAPRAMFLPTSMAEAMELAKLMAAGNFVPKHLRQKAGDCLAVLMQAARWGMDPFAVGNKTYFVNDRMAYEAQLVNAVVNSSGILRGRLQVDWHGAGNELLCTVSGTIRGDSRPKIVEQQLKTITTLNSPLWKQSPQQQLGYYTTRLWARLYVPEVLLGVYTVDEVEEMGVDNARNVSAPTRAQVAQRSAPEPQPERVIEAEPIREEQAQRQPRRRAAAAAPEPEQVKQEPEPQPAPEPRPSDEHAPAEERSATDWYDWLDGFEKEIERRSTAPDVNSVWANVRSELVDAPDNIFNRAEGLKNARLAELRG